MTVAGLTPSGTAGAASTAPPPARSGTRAGPQAATVGLSALLGVDPLLCRPVRDPDGLAAHQRIRHAVFVAEQRVFAESDVDAHDARDDVVHVLARHAGRAAGTVRLYPLDAAEWLGDRLAVLPEFRAINIGGPLVRFAVATATSRGARLMRAHVQPANERFFHRLGWRTDGPVEIYVDRPHLPMIIELGAPVCPWLAGEPLP